MLLILEDHIKHGIPVPTLSKWHHVNNLKQFKKGVLSGE